MWLLLPLHPLSEDQAILPLEVCRDDRAWLQLRDARLIPGQAKTRASLPPLASVLLQHSPSSLRLRSPVRFVAANRSAVAARVLPFPVRTLSDGNRVDVRSTSTRNAIRRV